jgi:hypothetical protein
LTVFIFSKLRKQDFCQIKNAKRAPPSPRKTAQSAETAPNHMKTPNLTLSNSTGAPEFRSKENEEDAGC